MIGAVPDVGEAVRSGTVDTLAYCSPELLVGDATAGHEMHDVFSMGVLLVAMPLGREPTNTLGAPFLPVVILLPHLARGHLFVAHSPRSRIVRWPAAAAAVVVLVVVPCCIVLRKGLTGCLATIGLWRVFCASSRRWRRH